MQIQLVFSLIIAFFAIIFAIQNTEVISIRFLIWETEGSLALILFISLVAGALISYLATAPAQIRQRRTISSQRKEISEIESRLNSTQAELEQLQAAAQAAEAAQIADEQPPAEAAAATEETPPA
jgi:uncharacterized integral membrane protein